MLKLKTLRSANKRFKKTSSGRYKHKAANMRHILVKKSSKHKRHLRKKSIVSKTSHNVLAKCLPYK